MARILVIDDDSAVRLSVKLVLEHAGHEVICASDGSQGLREFATAAPQLIVTDIIMPNKEGIETIIEIRARDAKIPILAMSGGGRVGNVEFLEAAIRHGANEILRKPFERKDLTAAVDRLLRA
jgi:CheY-like chemotaxis protein